RESKDIVQTLLDNDTNITFQNEHKILSLYEIIEEQTVEIVQILLNNESNVNSKDKNGQTPLFHVITRKNMNFIEMLLKKNADVDIVDKYGFIPLTIAVETGNTLIVQLLLDNKANVNFKNEYGITALYLASFKGNEDMVKVLLEYGANMNDLTSFEEILVNAKKVAKIEVVLRLLVDCTTNNIQGVDNDFSESNVVTNIIKTVSNDWAGIDLNKELNTAIEEGLINLDTIRNLIDWNCDFNLTDNLWTIILNLIEKINNSDIDEAFIDCIFDGTMEDQVTKLCKALAEEENLDVIKILLRNGVTANNTDQKSGLTLLQTAIQLDHEGFVEILLENNADVNLANNSNTPLCIAIHKQNIKIVELLLKFGADVNSTCENDALLCVAVRTQNIDLIKILLQYGCNVNHVDNYGLTPLMNAVAIQNTAIVQTLLIEGVDVDFEEKSGLTALFIAVLAKNKCIVDMLFTYGANKNIKTSGEMLLQKVKDLRKAGVLISPTSH
ncbi:hypothetical protein Trydic_g12130, partial [Trypoxylus dichotomus]